MGTVAGEGLDVLSEEHPAVALVAGFLDSLQSDRTRAAYLNDLRDFDRWCASKAIGLLDAKRPQIDAYARNLERMGRARSTVSRRLATISGFFRYLEEEGAITLSPATFVRRPFVDRSVRSLGLEREEAARLLEAAAVASPRDHALVCLLLLNGLRVTEACLANVGDLGFERGHTTLALLRRGGVGEVVPLAERTVRALTAHLDGRRRGPLLTSGGPLDPGLGAAELEARRLDRHDATRVVRRLANRAEITKRVTPQTLRATMITLSLDAGVTLRDVQESAGHVDLETTRRYDRRMTRMDRHATYRLTEYLEHPAVRTPPRPGRRAASDDPGEPT
jgi:integrase/recombinase XerD